MATNNTTTVTPPAYDTTTGARTDYGKSIGAVDMLGGKAISSSPVTIVTSNQSKANYANNVNTMNNANAGIVASNPSVVDYLNTTGQKSDYNSRLALATSMGINNYTGTATQNTLMLNTLRSGTNGSNSNTDTPGAGGTGMNGTKTDTSKTDINAPSVVSTSVDSTGNTIATNEDGSYSITYSDGTLAKLPKGMDPALASLQHDNIIALQKQKDKSKELMDELANTLANNPASQVAASRISASYDKLISQMEDKNKILAGTQMKNSARTGMMQYANEMDTNFKSMELDRSLSRIEDLITKKNDAIQKSNDAYKAGDVKAFDAASKDYEANLKNMNAAIKGVQDQINSQIKLNDAEIKQEQTLARQRTLDSYKASTATARAVATQIKDITDPVKIDEIITNSANELGITDPTILKSAVEKEQAIMEKESVGISNTKSTIANRDKTKTAKETTIVSFDKPTTTSLLGSGLSGADIKVLKTAIEKYGAQSVIDNPKITEGTKVVLEDLYGVTRTK